MFLSQFLARSYILSGIRDMNLKPALVVGDYRFDMLGRLRTLSRACKAIIRGELSPPNPKPS
jgi:hypothetical protein